MGGMERCRECMVDIGRREGEIIRMAREEVAKQ